jgi:hypothetical protein
VLLTVSHTISPKNAEEYILTKAIAFELSWQANVSDCRKDSIGASLVTGHDFSRAAKHSQKEVGL